MIKLVLHYHYNIASPGPEMKAKVGKAFIIVWIWNDLQKKDLTVGMTLRENLLSASFYGKLGLHNN